MGGGGLSDFNYKTVTVTHERDREKDGFLLF